MSAQAIAEIDAQLFRARWMLWHATWATNVEQLEAAMIAIDVLLDRRFALRQTVAAAPVALAA